jgi:DNA-binding IclR family transcriptional regulator
MPARHHRTVDRTIAIMEEASRSSDGISLGELALRLQAPKSSIQELTNGLLATGYLVETAGRFLLGPGAFVLSWGTAGMSMRRVRHEELEVAQQRMGVPLFVGVRVGDDHVFIDQAGEDVMMDFVSSTHPRRPLLITATGKVILANLPATERNEFLRRMQREQPEQVEAFLQEFEGIRTTHLAYNYGAAAPRRFAVATPLIDPDGTFLAAICASGSPDWAERLPQIGAALLEAVGAWRFPKARRRAAG